MSWKSIVIAGLLCVLAAPVFALEANPITSKLLGLDTAGNWVWEISVDPDQTTFTNPVEVTRPRIVATVARWRSSWALRTTGRGVVSAAKNATNFPSDNKGNGPAGWGETSTARGLTRTKASRSTPRPTVLSRIWVANSSAPSTALPRPKMVRWLHCGCIPKARPQVLLTTGLNFQGDYTAGGVTGGALPLFAENNVKLASSSPRQARV